MKYLVPAEPVKPKYERVEYSEARNKPTFLIKEHPRGDVLIGIEGHGGGVFCYIKYEEFSELAAAIQTFSDQITKERG